MARITPISGFPELLPGARIVEQQVVDRLRTVFELHGFASVETRAVEPLSQLARKGEIDQEIYLLRRLAETAEAAEQGDPGDQLGLHYDLTVPFARYVLENAGHLHFPFRRYQIQKVWRGERPQEGRYREFAQADIDVVGLGNLPDHYDIELAVVMLTALERLHVDLGVPPALMHVSNRKLSEGFYRGLGIDDTAAVLQRVDKFDKIGPDRVRGLLVDELGLTDTVAGRCVALAEIQTADESFVDRVRALGVTDPLLEEGLELLAAVVRAAGELVPGRLVADLKIARGLDYYTGTVYETELVGHASIGSVSSGGRYDELASDGKTTYPGVGVSLGVSRMLVPLLGRGVLRATRSVPTCVLVAVDAEDRRADADRVATRLRARGIATEVAPAADKFGKQIRYADRRGIPFVWFTGTGEVKDIRSGDQVPADADLWTPAAEDLEPRVVPGE